MTRLPHIPSTGPTRRLVRDGVCALIAAAAFTAPAIAEQQAPRRVIAVGDIHGAYDSFVAILTKAGLIDHDLKWVGGTATLVQTGDFSDRGPDVKKVMDLLMQLENRARSAGGQVIALNGNHEVLQVLGDLRYVTPEITAPFADERSEYRRERAWLQYEDLVKARSRVRQKLPEAYRQTRDAWMAAHPRGWIEYREMFTARGAYGRWIRTKAIAASIDGTIFMHAGMNPDQPPTTVEQVNSRARSEMARYEAFFQRMNDRKLVLPFFTFPEVLQVAASEIEAASTIIEAAKADGSQPDLSTFDLPLLQEAVEILKMSEWSLLAGEGPLWFRGYATWPEPDTTEKVTTFLDTIKAKRIVVGHTPSKDGRITIRYGGRVALIDTGMLIGVYKGHPGALEIRGDELIPIYAAGHEPTQHASSARRLFAAPAAALP